MLAPPAGRTAFGLSRPDQQSGSSLWRICRSWCLAERSSSPHLEIRLISRSSSRTSKSNSLEVLLHNALEEDSRVLLIQLTPKGKARYPAFQMHRKHITALSPTQTYTPKRTRTPLIHIRCILPRFPSWHLNELPLECRCERNLRLSSSEHPALRVNQNSF